MLDLYETLIVQWCLPGLIVWPILLFRLLSERDFAGAAIMVPCAPMVLVFWPGLLGRTFKK